VRDDAYESLLHYLRRTADLQSAAALLEWDLETMMPAANAEHRARQLELLAGMVHERETSPELGRRLAEAAQSHAASEEGTPEHATVREAYRAYHRAVKLPKRLVEELARTTSQARLAWAESKRKSDFATFRPWLERIVALKREEAEAVGGGGELYDALLDAYEPGATAAQLRDLFTPLRARLSKLLQRIVESPRKPDASILRRGAPVAAQEAFCRQVAQAIGFDFAQGRLDVTVHPFCSTLGPFDCRLTTRYDEARFLDGFFSVLHEVGHGLYEQGLPKDRFGTPLGQAASFGVHESQSRLWENLVGRGLAFWRHFFPIARERFPAALQGVRLDDFLFAVNEVTRSFIRIEADEVTYNLHVMLRFELETALLSGKLAVADLPGAWSDAFRRDFDITPPDDAHGCLQDIHWSMGSFGYFPTYTLGNVYAAQLHRAARRDLGDLEARMARGDFSTLLAWLRERVHRHGKRWEPPELVRRAAGEAASPDALVEHLESKFGALYGL